MNPPPTTIRSPGSSRNSRIVQEVRNPTRSSPSIGGSASRVPVLRKTRSASIVVPSISSRSAPTNRPCPSNSSTSVLFTTAR